MSIKTNKPSNVIAREHGRRMYMSDKSYAEQIRIPTQKAADNAIETKHSEFKKPYLSDTYEEMEYFADPAPTYPPWPVNFDTPWMGTPVPDFEDMYNPWNLLFRCFPDGCWCAGEERCFAANCSYEIVNVEFAFFSYPGWSLSWTKTQVCITVPEDAHGSAYIDITMKAPVPYTDDIRSLWKRTYKFVEGTHGNISIGECKASECCADTGMAWDTGTSAATVARSASCTVAITDSLNGGPYTWAVSGTGFTLDNATTTGLTNTLNADATACGSATITVTGCNGTAVTGYVRCTTGAWVLQSWSCPIPGPWTTLTTGFNFSVERVNGQYKVQQFIGASYTWNIPDTHCSDIDCTTKGDTTECVSWTCEETRGDTTCGYWCCQDACDSNAGSCQRNNLKRLYKWVCS